jgi:hypothetical protein
MALGWSDFWRNFYDGKGGTRMTSYKDPREMQPEEQVAFDAWERQMAMQMQLAEAERKGAMGALSATMAENSKLADENYMLRQTLNQYGLTIHEQAAELAALRRVDSLAIEQLEANDMLHRLVEHVRGLCYKYSLPDKQLLLDAVKAYDALLERTASKIGGGALEPRPLRHIGDCQGERVEGVAGGQPPGPPEGEDGAWLFSTPHPVTILCETCFNEIDEAGKPTVAELKSPTKTRYKPCPKCGGRRPLHVNNVKIFG